MNEQRGAIKIEGATPAETVSNFTDYILDNKDKFSKEAIEKAEKVRKDLDLEKED